MRHQYPTDLTDQQWQLIEPLFGFRKKGFQPKHSKREILNAVFYILRTGCAWRFLPHDFPKWTAVYAQFRKWEQMGLFIKLNDLLRTTLRRQAQRKETPSGAIVDSQTVKTTEKGGYLKVMMRLRELRAGREQFW